MGRRLPYTKEFDLLIAARTRKKALSDIRKFAKDRGWVAQKITLQKKKMLFDKRTLFNTQFSVKLRRGKVRR